jgi:hypothetical protein
VHFETDDRDLGTLPSYERAECAVAAAAVE